MNSGIFTPFSEKDLIPKEEKLDVVRKGKKLSIGLPKETCLDEKRLCLTPDAVQVLVEAGHQIVIESHAGEGSFYTDLQYSEAGAAICHNSTEAFSQNLTLKVNPPTLEEINYLKPNTLLISALQINLRNTEYFQALAQKKINAIGFEFLVDQYNQKPLVRLIGEIAGNAAVLYAAQLLSDSNGLMLGGITGVRPVEVVILGAGIVGEHSAKAALGLGATVKVFDNSLSKLRRLHNILGNGISSSIIDPKELRKSLRRADVVIGALPCINRPPIITEEMIAVMKKGSVIVDLTVDSESCIETSKVTCYKNPYFLRDGIVHCGLPNLTSKVPRTTTKAISNFFLSYILDQDNQGGFENLLTWREEHRKSFYLYKGFHTQQVICKKFDLPFHDINLLIF